MNAVRITLRLSTFALLTSGLVVALAVQEVLLIAAPVARRHGRSRLFGLWCTAMHPVLGLRVTTTGPMPTAPFLLVSNHLSYVDVIVYGAKLRAAFVAKSEVAGWPVVGPLARWVGTIFVDRRVRRDVTRVNASTEAALDDGLGVVVFAEGTSSAGDEVLPFRSSLLEPAARADHPLVAAAIGYRTPPGSPPARDVVAWWADMTFTGHFLTLLTLPRVEARVSFAPAEPIDADRHALADRLHRTVSGLHAGIGLGDQTGPIGGRILTPTSVSSSEGTASTPEVPGSAPDARPAPHPEREPACP